MTWGWGSNWSLCPLLGPHHLCHYLLLPAASHTTPTTAGLIGILRAASPTLLTLRWRRTQESRVVLMGQMYSDEDKRGLVSFPSKAENGKSVPWRNHVLLGLEGLLRLLLPASDKWKLFASQHTCAAHPACAFVCVFVVKTVSICLYKVTCRTGHLQYDISEGFW